ncbi:MAG TPA: hemerythrin domain-containing protein [Tissierellaceae bacterium]
MDNLSAMSYSEILEHILKEYHSYLKRELPEIERLVFTIYKVHFFDSGKVLEKVHKLYGQLKAVLESHIIKEERALFFDIKDYEKNPSNELLEKIIDWINRVDKDNEEAMEIMKNLRAYTNEYELPPTSCPTFEDTYRRLQELEKNLKEHIETENYIFDRLKREK